MQRNEALRKLRSLEGQDLVSIAEKYDDVTVWKDGRINKGWAGHTVERYLGLARNSSRSPNFGSWELKVVPLVRRPNGSVAVKETMAITMIDPVEVGAKEFQDSHLFLKLKRMIVVARVFESKQEIRSICYQVTEFDLDDPEMYGQIEQDYNDVQQVIRKQGFHALSGRMGVLVQPRTKGPGHGSRSRAFYARKPLVARILGIGD